MSIKTATHDAVELFQRGAVTFAQIERNGILVDRKYLEWQLRKNAYRTKRLEEEFKNSKIYSAWYKKFRLKTKLGNKQQLETIVFDVMGHKRTGRLTTGGKSKNQKYSSDEAAFEFVKDPAVKTYFRAEKEKKARSYLLQMQREMCDDDYMHPFSNLTTTISLRSSMDKVSFQNFPIRDPLQAKPIRSCIIAPKGYRVAEIDFEQNEVKWSVVYHGDPNLRKELFDPDADMHRDMAMACFKLDRKDVEVNKYDPKRLKRYCAKNKFVFPEFYGSFWRDCAKNMWDAIDLYELKTAKGVPLKEHLRKKGIKGLGEIKGETGEKSTGRLETQKGTFYEHVRLVEDKFWKERFRVYNDWKQEWWEKFCRRGYFRYKTGFIGSGVLDRKQTCNYPIQGSAFHGLLWCLCELQDWLNKKGMKTKIIAQIHDSIILYIWHSEIDDVLRKAKQIMTKRILQHWKFIDVPFSIDAEIAPKGGNWFQKQKVKIA